MTSPDPDVHVVVAAGGVVVARVRHDDGIFDVTRGRSGWSCSCTQAGNCVHVLSVRQLTEAPDMQVPVREQCVRRLETRHADKETPT